MTAPPDRAALEALLPCPFCGGEASFESVERGPNAPHRWTVGCNENGPKDGTVFEVLCYGFQSLTTFATKREAAAAWNRRAHISPPSPWRNMDEAPRDGTEILAMLFESNVPVVISFDEDAPQSSHPWMTLAGPSYHRDAPKAWMRIPLPSPPREKESEK